MSDETPVTAFQVDKLRVEIYANRQAMGRAAAARASQVLQQALAAQTYAAAIFAAAPSQNELLENLAKAKVDWPRVTAFHLDEYIGLDADAPQSFRRFLYEALWGYVPSGKIETIQGEAPDPVQECQRYAHLLQTNPLDLACIGIGENGHIAFNEPHLADFNDPQAVKIVDLDNTSRQQQVNDACFARLEEVPTQAITVTIPPIVAAKAVVCVVPGAKKAQAVYHTLYGPVQPECPASVLRQHPNATLFLDRDSANLLKRQES